LLIIADEYDNDVDIQAYILNTLGQAQNLFNSDYKYPFEICKEVAKTLDFEFFCNTQGHIEFRPPQYNRVPLSLVLKMFLLNENNGTKIYPKFLDSLFETRLGSVEKEIEILDLQISEQVILLNIPASTGQSTTVVTSGLTEEEISKNQFIRSESEISANTVEASAKELVSIRNKIKGETGYESRLADVESAEKEVRRFNDPSNTQVNSSRLQLTQKLAQLKSKKQSLETTLQKLEAAGTRNKGGIGDFKKEKLNDLLTPFKNLIEDDYNDFLGPGSSSRFIIYDDQIISSNFTESDETAFCRADVNGEVDLLGDGPGKLGIEKQLWAGATDFDIWRQYGYRPLGGPFNKPFLKDAKSQCAPYALFLLARAKRDIVRARLVLYGNEYYQLGDVVYINSRDMLYYVHDISHNFSYENGSFQTTLELRYGHPLGEYIPTPLDSIGKSIVTNQIDFNKILISRETSSKKFGVHLGLVKFKEEAKDDEFKEMLKEPFARFNVTELKRSLLVARNHIEPNNPKVKVEVRGWFKNEDDISKVQTRMNAVVTWLMKPEGRWIEHEDGRYIVLGDQFPNSSLQANEIANKSDNEPVTPIPFGVGDGKPLEGENLAKSRVPGEEVLGADINGEPYNIIEIVLLFE
jgi:hypothetical protein